MSEQDQRDASEVQQDEDVEAHGLKEAAAAGISAAAMLAGAGVAAAQPTAVEGVAKAKAPQAVNKADSVIKGAAVEKVSHPVLKGEYGIKRGASVNKIADKF